MKAKSRKASHSKLPLFWAYFEKMELFMSEWAYSLRSKNNVKLTKFAKTCFSKQECMRMRKYE